MAPSEASTTTTVSRSEVTEDRHVEPDYRGARRERLAMFMRVDAWSVAPGGHCLGTGRWHEQLRWFRPES
jgi:hypothetical protein